jgi:Tfp pilus assembly protein PilO
MKVLNIEDYLHSLDEKLKDKSKKDKMMLYIMIFVSLVTFSYVMFWDTSFQLFKTNQAKVDVLKQKIKTDELYLKYNTPAVIAKIDEDIKNIKMKLVEYKDKNQYIKTKLESIPFLLYDERVWGEYLNSIDIKAKKYNVKILDFRNTYNDLNQSFGHVLDISIFSNGNYKNTLKFINSLEESDLVVDLHDMNISARDKLDSNLSLSVWGIRY